MTIKVDWGDKLEPHELLHEMTFQDTNYQNLYNIAITALEAAGVLVVDTHHEPYGCWDCPERPHECPLCKVDANCAEMLRPQILHISCIMPEEATS